MVCTKNSSYKVLNYIMQPPYSLNLWIVSWDKCLLFHPKNFNAHSAKSHSTPIPILPRFLASSRLQYKQQVRLTAHSLLIPLRGCAITSGDANLLLLSSVSPGPPHSQNLHLPPTTQCKSQINSFIILSFAQIRLQGMASSFSCFNDRRDLPDLTALLLLTSISKSTALGLIVIAPEHATYISQILEMIHMLSSKSTSAAT